MDIVTHKNALKILYSLILRKSAVIPFVYPTEVRPAFDIGYGGVPLERCSPEQVGIPSEHILNLLDKLSAEPSLDMQTVTIARNGKIISCGEFFPYRTDIMHITHSLSKSVTCLGVGLLYDDGILNENERVCDIFDTDGFTLSKMTKSSLKIRHLLTMTSGISFNEAGSVTDGNWVKAFLESNRKFPFGKQFDYNSMNTYMLSAVVCKKTGSSLSALVNERIFKPLGIHSFYWEKCPSGIEKGGWGLYMFPEDIMKLGQLILQKGEYNGKRIISREWIEKATSVQVKTPSLSGVYDYGYQMWVDEQHDEVLFNGMFGQNLHIFRRTNILVMTTGGNGDIFQRCRAYPIIKKYFGKSFTPNTVLPENSDALSRLREKEKRLCKRSSFEEDFLSSPHPSPSDFINRVASHRYICDKNEVTGISVLPTLVQAVHNNFSDGITELSFEYINGEFYVVFNENIGKTQLKVGFDSAVYQNIKIGHETLLTAVYGEAVTDEDKNDVLKLTVAFPELSNTRRFKFYFYKNTLTVKCNETPGYDFALNSIKMIADDSLKESTVKAITPRISKELKKTLDNFLSPTFHATKLL